MTTHPEIPPDREDGRSSWVHLALIITDKLDHLHLLARLAIAVALLALATGPWRGLWAPVALLGAGMMAADWVMLRLLPRRERSWGPATPPWLGLAVVRAALAGGLGLLAAHRGGLLALLALEIALSAVAVYATWVEPFRVGVTGQTLALPGWRGEPLRLLHITDVHFEGDSPREAALLALATDLHPDLIVLTGDYLNLSSVYDPAAQQGARRLLRQLRAPLGVYAVTGSPPVDVAGIVPEIFADLDIHWLDDAGARIQRGPDALWLLGVRTTYDADRDAAALTRLRASLPNGAPIVLLTHTPDLMPVAAELGIDLYLCGHTHGGQIRLPLYGAMATSSRWGKRYEMGRYQEQGTTLYVSRGLGLEGLGAPRARFLAPPEIVMWTLH